MGKNDDENYTRQSARMCAKVVGTDDATGRSTFPPDKVRSINALKLLRGRDKAVEEDEGNKDARRLGLFVRICSRGSGIGLEFIVWRAGGD